VSVQRRHLSAQAFDDKSWSQASNAHTLLISIGVVAAVLMIVRACYRVQRTTKINDPGDPLFSMIARGDAHARRKKKDAASVVDAGPDARAG